MTAERLTLRRPDDWHVHLRDGPLLGAVAPHTARQFARAIVMPNLDPPVTTTALAVAYRERIFAALPARPEFQPLMTIYLTDETDPGDVEAGYRDDVLTACKLYPANATTNSALGVTSVDRIHGVLETLQRIGMPLLIHGEVTDPDVDIYDREAVFIDTVLAPLLRRFPQLVVVLEHITTREAVDFVREGGPLLGATITPHHLTINRSDMFAGGLRPHLYCLPTAKRESHRRALRRAAVSGDPKFFLGTDSAPHTASAKESACGCAGIFNAPCALEVYAEVFEEEGALERLEAFAAEFGPRFYGLALNEATVTLVRDPAPVPETLAAGDAVLKPFRGGTTTRWRLEAPS